MEEPLLNLEFYPYPLYFGLIALFPILAILRLRRHSLGYLAGFSLFWLYLLAVLNVMFFPITIESYWLSQLTFENTLRSIGRINLIPFHYGDLFNMGPLYVIRELAGNLLLTMPLGFLLPFLMPSANRRPTRLVLAGGVVFEAAQLFFMLTCIYAGYGHSIDINDVILNTLGTLIGYALYRGAVWTYEKAVSIMPSRLMVRS